ncbi:hypothetical protein GGP41_005130 [Bipolaris sorokiniana]|uniref:Uncharacterized protein n=1 Tax=Cochliobolus sativus TaxID=45130 RepID=A0A8H5ZI81_COCSA|nr:hypothetical protein GGP41_005130 [Bipolaris sorokiniana]
MYNHNDGNDSPMQPNISTFSPKRPPQFRNCNYDCGLGCKKDSDDEGGGADDDQTVVGEEENLYSDAEAQDESGGESEDLSGSEESMPDSGASASDGTGGEFSSSLESGDMSASMVVEPTSSGDRSPLVAQPRKYYTIDRPHTCPVSLADEVLLPTNTLAAQSAG